MKKKKTEEADKKNSLPLKYLLIGLLALVIIPLLLFALYSVAYQNKNYLHQNIGNLNFGGKNKGETIKILKENSDRFMADKITLKNTDTGKTYSIDPVEIGLAYDVDKTADEIWSYGRDGSALLNLFNQAKSLFSRRSVSMIFSFNHKGLTQKITAIAEELDEPEKDYTLIYKGEKFELSTERSPGKRIDREYIDKSIRERFASLTIQEFSFPLNQYEPKVALESAKTALTEANAIIEKGELVLKSENQEFKADRDTIAGFLTTESNGSELEITFNEDRIKKFLETIAKTIDVEPNNAKLKVENGKISIFEQARIGKMLDLSETTNEIKSNLLARINGVSNQINLAVKSKKPQITETEISSLGIREQIGTGTTSFAGSPANRVHNITVGANGINGVLLAPGETFSTLQHLGSIDASGGYLEELVIKDDSTVPEFGGGLCQVSTTLFRMALNAGMKITERSNHKYRVGYFEPLVGMDATIYDPAPDFKFINNYKTHILIQSRIEGKKLTFDVYGTKDGRKIEVSPPSAFDITSPGEPIVTETETLPAGERKQIEKSHQGATARFDYKVTSASGEVLQQKTFISKYVPWPEKWLVGKAISLPATPACTDGQQNGDEAGIDCGGSCPSACQ